MPESFTVTYSPKEFKNDKWYRSCKKNPYQDWLDRGSYKDCIINYICSQPAREGVAGNTIYMEFYPYYECIEYDSHEFDYDFNINERKYDNTRKSFFWNKLQLKFNNNTKIISLLESSSINEEELYMIEYMLQKLISVFCNGWNYELPDDLLINPNKYKPKNGLDFVCNVIVDKDPNPSYRGRVYGTYLTYDDEVIKIQKIYRGWITRKKYRYNPHTIGKYLILKEFNKLLKN